MKMKKNELIPSLDVKETWSKPELETVSVKESTLNGFIAINDGAFFS